MRLPLIALVVVLALVAGAAARGDEPSDLKAMRVLKTDLDAALYYETQALASAKSRDSAKAHEQLVNARGALNDMEDAVRELTPSTFYASQFLLLNHTPEPWLRLEDQYANVLAYDADARFQVGSTLVTTLEKANALKHEMLDFVTAAIHSRCLELINLRGPIEVNGVPQGHSQLTVSVTCDDPIEQLDLAIENVRWTSVDAGKNATKTADGGKVLEVDAHGAKTVTVSAQTTPDAAAGDRIEGDIVEIKGDSGPPIDETM
jgi:hypothetical protein